MKKLRIILLILIITVLSIQFAFGQDSNKSLTFSDLNESHWAYESINKLIDKSYINGYPDGTFRPDGNITRAEFVKIANQIFSYNQKQKTLNFTDVLEGEWYYDYILVAQEAGYINGYPDNTFKPNGLITREELCKILVAINNFIELPYDKSPKDEVSPWAEEYVTKVISNRIMFLDINNNFRATEKATRAEACDALAKFILEELDESGSTGDSGSSSEELFDTMDRVIRRINAKVIPELNTAQKSIINDIIYNMNLYKENTSYDYKSAAKVTYEKYKKLTEKEQEEIKYLIQLENETQDLMNLKEFFFPDIQI